MGTLVLIKSGIPSLWKDIPFPVLTIKQEVKANLPNRDTDRGYKHPPPLFSLSKMKRDDCPGFNLV